MKFSLSVAVSLLFAFTEAANLPGTWPAVDKPPPPVASWTSMVDQSKIPKAPLVPAAKVGTQCVANDPYCDWSCTGCTRPDTDVVKCPNQGDWGLSYDDGPTPFTTTLLDFYAKQNYKATFFVIGSRVYENPDILRRAVQEGHQIGVHTWSHPYLTSQSNEQIIAEIKWTEKAIYDATGLTPKYMRPPFGDCDDRVRGIMKQLGYKLVIWDYDTNDWMSGEDKTFQLSWINGNFTEWVKNTTSGHVTLEHDLYNQTVDRAVQCAPIVAGAGFKIKPVSVCTGDNQPYVENVSLGQFGPSYSNSSSSSSSSSSSGSYTSGSSSSGSYTSGSSSSGSYSSGSYSSGSSSYGSGANLVSTPSSSPSPSATPSANAASLNSASLLSFASLVIGFMLI